MRIIAGKYKKTPLKTIESDSTRPTKDMVKEALFSSIDVEGLNFLDVFSGSGAIGIEALSRNASNVYFNDINRECVNIIKENLNKVHEPIKNIYNLDWESFINRLDIKFDYVYIDPPYAFNEYNKLLKLLIDRNLLNNNCIVIFELRKNVDLNDELYSFKCFKEKRYGITKLRYYKENTNE